MFRETPLSPAEVKIHSLLLQKFHFGELLHYTGSCRKSTFILETSTKETWLWLVNVIPTKLSSLRILKISPNKQKNPHKKTTTVKKWSRKRFPWPSNPIICYCRLLTT